VIVGRYRVKFQFGARRLASLLDTTLEVAIQIIVVAPTPKRADDHLMVYTNLKGMRRAGCRILVCELVFAMRALKCDEDNDDRRINALDEPVSKIHTFSGKPAHRDLRHAPVEPVRSEDRIVVRRRHRDDRHRRVIRRHGCSNSGEVEGCVECLGPRAHNVKRLCFEREVSG
jgi:hypothetical protein